MGVYLNDSLRFFTELRLSAILLLCVALFILLHLPKNHLPLSDADRCIYYLLRPQRLGHATPSRTQKWQLLSACNPHSAPPHSSLVGFLQ